MRLSVLDQSPIPEGSTGGQALRNSIDLAQHCERLGFYRYWVAEHHGTPGLADASPEVLIGPIAQATKTMRVGSGGIMLPHYSPLKVAETFSMLAGMFEGRIDLGLGRAPGSDARTAFALQRDRRQGSPDDFTDQLDELFAYLWDRVPEDHPFANVAKLPGRPYRPAPWLLGSSPQSGIWAAQFGLPYCFADFINPAGAEHVKRYRDQFKASFISSTSYTAVASWVICAETDSEAHRLASSHRMLMDMLHRGRLIAVPSVEKSLDYLRENGLPLDGPPRGRRTIVGSPQTVRAGIEAVAQEYDADEVMVVNILFDHEARKRSYELVAGAFADRAQPAATNPTGAADVAPTNRAGDR
jgi:luciferase family oxidoreductase group 1